MAEAGKGQRGRPKAAEGEPPMPKAWKDTETLAGVLAWLEKSEEGADAALEEKAQKAYSAQLDYVHSNVKEFEPSQHRWNKKIYIYTMEESKKRRPKRTVGGLKANYTETRKFCNNNILPVYHKKHNKDGTPPSGTNRDSLIAELKKELGLDAAAVPTDAANHEDAGEPELDGDDDSPQGADKSRKQAPAAARFWLTWLHLGPLGQCHPDFMTPDPPGSSESAARKPAGRAAKCAAFYERVKADHRSKVQKPMEQAKVEEAKLDMLKKLHRDNKLANRQRAATAHTYACKVASDEFDATCNRVEKQLELARKRKNKELIVTLEAKLDGLLEKGPTLPDPPEQESSSEEEEEVVAGEEDEEADDDDNGL